MTHAHDYLPLAQFDRWREMTLAEARALIAAPDWQAQVDAAGRNLLMQAFAFFAPGAVVVEILSSAIKQGVLAQMCRHQDHVGACLPAYALRHLHKEWLPSADLRGALFTHGVRNAQGHGLLRQMFDLSCAEDPEDGIPSLAVRSVGFSIADMPSLTVDDWQWGLEDRSEQLLAWWFGRVLESETGFGLVFHDDLEATLAWLLPVFEQDRAAWQRPLRECLETMQILQRLRDPEARSPGAALDILESARPALLAHRQRWGPRFLLPLVLLYQGREGVWEAFLASAELQHTIHSVGASPSNRL